jgi:putative Mg2+ transporter-C (MgtC) family protein
MQQEVELLVRLIAAALFTGAIGWERETAHKSAGLRTHVLVGVAACLFVTLGISVAGDYPGNQAGPVRIEPFALIQAVAVGIGFLGSGIVRMRSDDARPQGLTTAASVWAASGVGLGAGFGKYILAGGATLMLLFVLRVVEHFERRYLASRTRDTLNPER